MKYSIQCGIGARTDIENNRTDPRSKPAWIHPIEVNKCAKAIQKRKNFPFLLNRWY